MISGTLEEAISNIDRSFEVTALCCTSGSFCEGQGYDKILIKKCRTAVRIIRHSPAGI